MKTYTLLQKPPPDQETWTYTLPPDALTPHQKHTTFGKCIKFTADSITFQMNHLPDNRILQSDDISKFILASFADLRFPDSSMRVTADYIKRFLKAGFSLNGVQYRFYHHSNSQLVSAKHILREIGLIPIYISGVVAVSYEKRILTKSLMLGYTNLVTSVKS